MKLFSLGIILSHFIISIAADEQGPRIEQQCPYKEPLSKIIFNNNETLFYDFIALKPNCRIVDTNKRAPLHIALEKGAMRIADSLLRESIDPNAVDDQDRTAVHYAVIHDRGADFLDKFLDKCDPDLSKMDKTGRTALAYALELNKDESVKVLLNYGASIDVLDAEGVTPLFKSIREDNQKLFNALIEHNVNLNYQNKYGQTALMHALLYAKNDDAIVKLLTKNVDVDLQDVDGKTAVHWAMIVNRPEKVLQPLLAKSKNLMIQDSAGHAPIHKAVLKSFFVGVQALVNKGASCNALDKNGKTPLLHQLTLSAQVQSIRQLVLLGADPNLQDQEGNAPLHIAWKTNTGWIAPLIHCGAVKNIKNNAGKTPYDLAKEANNNAALIQFDNN